MVAPDCPRLRKTIDVILNKRWSRQRKQDAIVHAVKHWVTVREGMSLATLLGYEMGRFDRHELKTED